MHSNPFKFMETNMKSRLFDKQYPTVEGNINNVAQEAGQILFESVCAICVHLYGRAKKGQGKTGYESLLVPHWLFVRRKDKRVRRQFIALCVNTFSLSTEIYTENAM